MCQSSDSWRLNLSASQARVNPLQHRVNQPEIVSEASVYRLLKAHDLIARAFLILAESVGDSRIGISLIQHVSWNGGQLAWRELILLICVSELWRQFCGACRAGQWRCVSMSASRAW